MKLNFTEEKQYSYDGKYPDRLVIFGDNTIGYDENGMPESYRGKEFEWNALGQLKTAGSTEFAYDGLGRRIQKDGITFTYDLSGRLIKQSNGLEFVYDSSGLSGVTHNGTKYICRKNLQVDITHILDFDGGIVVKYTYDAWGNHRAVSESGTVLYDSAVGVTPGTENWVGNLNPFRYRSYYYDAETKLYYLQTRYYDPETGRFISQDDVSFINSQSLTGLNLYAYCENNPVNHTDPTGQSIILTCLIIGLVAGAIIGGAIGAKTAYDIASETGATGWELAGWTTLGTLGGAVVGGVIGAGIGASMGGLFAGAAAFGAFLGGGGLALVGGGILGGTAGLTAISIGTAVHIGIGVGVIGSLGFVLMGSGKPNQGKGGGFNDPSIKRAPDGSEWTKETMNEAQRQARKSGNFKRFAELKRFEKFVMKTRGTHDFIGVLGFVVAEWFRRFFDDQYN